ncbi:hypothetical protein LQ757_17285 [Agromyces sp. SYSU K20354]|uniref:SGNH hydrolase domain-containing protein n=1 Tax=Agromyces cavernae TaxID=2898659 RepID=UPI001E392946|nr:SGNH hydrolase domain-containing protein [Agromyces cavernae]MCD2444039.1 hypothetical protein [Agromyces cavernae]
MLAGILMPLSILGTGPTATAAASAVPVITMNVSATGVAYGKPLTVTGKAVLSGAPMKAATVSVVGRSAATNTWELLGRIVTASDGSYTFSFVPRSGYRLKTEMPATADRGYAQSPSAVISVQPQLYGVTPVGASLAVAGRAKTVSGFVHAELGGRRVKLARADGSTWTDIVETRFDAKGRFDLTFTPARSGTFVYRVIIPSVGGLVMKLGAVLSTEVKGSVAELASTNPACFGASTLLSPGCSNPALAGLLLPTTEAAALRFDTGGSYSSDCWQSDKFAPVPVCRFGSTSATARRIALVGDSHAAGLLVGLKGQLAARDWRLDTYLGVSCRWKDTNPECLPRTQAISAALLEQRYDVVLVTGLRQPASSTAASAAAVSDEYSAVWRPVLGTGTRIVAIADNGYLPATDTLACVTNDGGRNAASCVQKLSTLTAGIDPLIKAVADNPGTTLVDPTKYYCTLGPDGACPLVLGHVVVYRDRHHLSGTFALTLGPYLAADIAEKISQ